MLSNRFIAYLLLIVLLIMTLIIAFQPKSISVDGVLAHYAPMKVTVEEEGKTRVVDHYLVSAPIDAFMHRISFNEGDSIQKGQTLLILEPLPSSVLDPRRRAQAEATLGASEELEKIIKEMGVAANADKEIANIIFNRTTQLRKKKVVSQNDLDVAKAEKRRADAAYRASQFTWVFTQYLTRMSRSALDYEDTRQSEGDNRHFKVMSIVDGQVLKLADKSERVVKMGAVLMELGDIKHIEVEADVLSTVAVKLKSGMPVEIVRWGEDQVLNGVIKRVEPSGFTKVSALGVEEQRVTVIIDIKTEYSARAQLGHGYRVESRFILWSSNKVLQIPNSALFQDNDISPPDVQNKWAVYVINDNKLQKKSVKIGHRNHLMTEVLDGLIEGEQLVAYFSNELQAGVNVELREKGQ